MVVPVLGGVVLAAVVPRITLELGDRTRAVLEDDHPAAGQPVGLVLDAVDDLHLLPRGIEVVYAAPGALELVELRDRFFY